ncbi:L-threonylcarbamoyladenylate synthase [Flavicella sediminum]|uniref:L-threonylcarbamoyladenylate synthase n=1 Tax=Flavicella sediminum TaxID=2585141 RepID=UPI0011202B8A|nr:L-threonylcarbamoyladenylate synthase [Flavicella sediminum]
MIAEIETTNVFLENHKIILYPTDTVWGIGCDATNEEAVAKIYQLKNREETKSLIILVNSVEMLQEYVSYVPQKALEIIKLAKKPTTIIYENPKGLAKNTIASDNTIAIRIVKDEFCEQLIQKFGKPIVSTSANVSGEATPKSFSEISDAVLRNVDYIVNSQHDKMADKSSTILRIVNKDEIEVIRE